MKHILKQLTSYFELVSGEFQVSISLINDFALTEVICLLCYISIFPLWDILISI